MKTMLYIVFVIALAASSASATEQRPDRVVWDGAEYGLHYAFPMEVYFAKYPESRPKTKCMSTALYRGYIATFEFKADTLVLKDIQIEVCETTDDGRLECEWRSVRSQLLPGGEELPLDWFTGILLLPHGKRVGNTSWGSDSNYSKYLLLEVKEGRLTEKRLLDREQYLVFKQKQFQAFKKTKAYKKLLERLKKGNETQEEIDAMIRNWVVRYTTEFLDTKREASPSSEAVDGGG